MKTTFKKLLYLFTILSILIIPSVLECMAYTNKAKTIEDDETFIVVGSVAGKKYTFYNAQLCSKKYADTKNFMPKLKDDEALIKIVKIQGINTQEETFVISDKLYNMIKLDYNKRISYGEFTEDDNELYGSVLSNIMDNKSEEAYKLLKGENSK